MPDTPGLNALTTDRFWSKVDQSRADGCWMWSASLNDDGYGQYWDIGQKRVRKAHRVAWEMANGQVSVGLELDHLCRNPSCVNPSHLEPVTHTENVRRGKWATATHCRNGHPFDEANTRHTGRQRVCRACERVSYARKVAANPERYRMLARARTAAWQRRQREKVNA